MSKLNKIDLGKYDLNKLLRNPGLIHKIQDNIIALTGETFLHKALRDGAKENIKECIKTIIDQYKDNPVLMLDVVGLGTMALIEEFSGEALLK